ncbi:MCE family protein [Mycolicibacterium fluoranthenivorans]|uniref:MCE family protein n=1 Tax=Mycolicibacterium fluoranthenivorans TaxID=258505 RepID=UPI002E2978FA|nr:MCE family protein [Mycolicibacterium fluoranthenivorans]
MIVSACQFNGLNSIALPGTAGHGAGSYTIIAELPDIATLVQNSPVLADDVTVGSVSGLQGKQHPDGTFYAAVTLSLNGGVHLPANVVATIGQTSLLGSQHIELAPPSDAAPEGTLMPGSVIPEARAGRYPTTEEVLSSLGVIVNKGNLGALQDITDELYSAVAGRAGQFADFLPRLAELTSTLNEQTDDLIRGAEQIDRLAGTVARSNDKLADTLDALPGALRALNANSGHIVDAFTALRRLGGTASRILAQIRTDFAADVKAAYAILKPIAEHADGLVDALPILPTYPIPQRGLKQAVRGDYLNVFITLDFTLRRFGENLFTTSGLDPNMKHLSEIINPPDFLTGSLANLSGQAADPFKIPPRATPAASTSTGGG